MLFTSVSVASGGKFTPTLRGLGSNTTTSHLHFGE